MKTDIQYLNEAHSDEEKSFVKRTISEQRIPYKQSFSVEKDLNFSIEFTQKSSDFRFFLRPCSRNEEVLFLVTIGGCDYYHPKKKDQMFLLERKIVAESLELLKKINFQNWTKCYGDLYEHDWQVTIQLTEWWNGWFYTGDEVYPPDWDLFREFVLFITHSVRPRNRIFDLCRQCVTSVRFYEYFGGPSGATKSWFAIHRLSNYSSECYAAISTDDSDFEEIYYPSSSVCDEYFKESTIIISKLIFDQYLKALKDIGAFKWKRPVNIPLGIDTPGWGLSIIYNNGKRYGSYCSNQEYLPRPNGWLSLLKENKKLFELIGVPKVVRVRK